MQIQRIAAAANAFLVAFTLTGGLSACAVVDDATLRAETMNATIGSYNSYAILLNIIRASNNEPLNFVAVVGGAPNSTLTANAAVPTFTFSPWHLSTYATSGNSASASASNILAVSAVDDPGSWQAMLTPVDVATIGFFIKQGYPRELLLRLFIDRIKKKHPIYPGGPTEVINDPTDPNFLQALKSLANMVVAGTTVEIGRGSSKVGDNPPSKICFNQADAIFAQDIVRQIETASGRQYVPARIPPDICGKWLPGQATASSAPDTSKSGGAKPTAAVSVPKGNVWYDLPPGLNEVQFTTRSAYAVYQYLGRILETKRQHKFTTILDDQNLVTIDMDSSQSCFSSVVFKGQSYCVPDSAQNMKRAFAILHQVAGLNLVHSSTPANLAVRVVP